MARSHTASTVARSWETKTSVVPLATTSLMRSRHFCWKWASPTASTSSTSRMSGSQEDGDGEAQADGHAGRIELHLAVDGGADLGEVHDVVEALGHLRGAIRPRMLP